MRYLGLLYENGQGGDRDYDQACQWFRSAAEAGNADAMVDLGYLYEFGWGVTRDYNQARRWFQKAADAGNAAAKQALLGLPSPNPSAAEWFAEAKRYLDSEDYALALAPLRKAAEAGNAEAMNQLAELYYYGYGVDEDFAKAREWYQKAAEAGNPLARGALSRLGPNGSPVPVTPSGRSLR
jgi:TPR repeat protein